MRPRAWHHLDELFAGSCDGNIPYYPLYYTYALLYLPSQKEVERHWPNINLTCLYTSTCVCVGMTYEEIEETFPEEFARRNTDKLAYRYPRFVYVVCCCFCWCVCVYSVIWVVWYDMCCSMMCKYDVCMHVCEISVIWFIITYTDKCMIRMCKYTIHFCNAYYIILV